MAYQGFPTNLIDFIRCCKDEGILKADFSNATSDYILTGRIICQQCGTVYNIKDGIVDLYAPIPRPNKQSLFEQKTRDIIAKNTHHTAGRAEGIIDEMEISPTLKRLQPLNGKTVLEIGCGTGRFTLRLVDRCKMVLAVDFSRESLLAVIKKLDQSKGSVGLVQADVSKFALRPNSFDLALSTLYSNLPTSQIRSASTRTVHNTLKVGGKYVLTAHHHEIRQRLKGTRVEGQYDNGIYYRNFTSSQLTEEICSYFSEIKTSTISIWLPFLSRKKKWRPSVSKICEQLPLINRLGNLLIATARKR